jgi:opacity protein-like surface antigen
MTRFKLLSAVALASATIVTPAVAQQAVQEPGAQAFYQSLGVGSHNYNYPQNALASVGRVDLSVAPPARHARPSARHHGSRR